MAIYRLLFLLVLVLFSCKKFKIEESDYTEKNYAKGNGVTDIDGNFYKTVIIGEQEWMAENLKVTKLNDGTPILKKTENSYENLPFYTWTNFDSINDSVFGKLYSLNVATNNVCPSGWHVPLVEDWNEFINYVGKRLMIGEKIKSVGILKDSSGLWDSERNLSTNETGFNALPTGRDSSTINKKSYFWTSTVITKDKYYTPYIYNIELSNKDDVMLMYDIPAYPPFYFSNSIRCVKD